MKKMTCRYCRQGLVLARDVTPNGRVSLRDHKGSATCIPNGFGNHEVLTPESPEYRCATCPALIHLVGGYWCAVADGSQWCADVITTSNMDSTVRHTPKLPDLSEPADILKFLNHRH